MEYNEKLIYETKRLILTRYNRFAGEIARANLEYRKNLKYKTAATDGKNVYFDPDYFASLSENDRVFLFAHELMHIKFNHMFRLIYKDGKKRDMDVWNVATDAIINANLERDGFIIKKGFVNRPEALNYTAEEFYELLLKEKEDNKDKEQEEQNIGDDHSMWEEAFEKSKNNTNSESDQKNDDQQDDEQQDDEQQSDEQQDDEQQPNSEQENYDDVNETEEFSKNRIERRAIAKENFERMKEKMLIESQKQKDSEEVNLGNVGDENNAVDWRLLLRREIDKSETVWSQNRSIAENNYAYRLEENDIEDEAQTEVMIDVSGSVDLEMVRAFLRMIKPILKESKLKVGCFNERYWGITEIKKVSDIDNYIIPEGARGNSCRTEDWDLAVRSFTKKREINKIVFTDGIPCPGNMPKLDLRNENIIWIVYGSTHFNPCCGKVINLTEEQLKNIQSCTTNTPEEETAETISM